MVTLNNHVIAQAGFLLRGALGTVVIFATFFCQIYVKTKAISPFERGARGIVPHYGKSGPSYCITFLKRFDKGLRQQILGQKLSISHGLYG